MNLTVSGAQAATITNALYSYKYLLLGLQGQGKLTPKGAADLAELDDVLAAVTQPSKEAAHAHN